MDYAEGARLIGKICRFWERKIPSTEAKKGDVQSEFDAWFEAIGDIPGGYADRIYEKFIRMETRPVNIPLRIREVYKGMAKDPTKKADFLISIIMARAQEYGISNLQAFYELRHPIRTKEINIGPCLRWLKSEGFTVDWAEFEKPAIHGFGREWKEKVVDGIAKIPSQREPGADEDEPYNGQF